MPALDTVIQSIETFARDASDLPTARLAFGVLSRMTASWGGPDVFVPVAESKKNSQNQGDNSSTAPDSSKLQTIPDWNITAMNRFTPLSWALLTSSKFNPRDSQARQVLNEIASMQLQILRKAGQPYLEVLKGQLASLGVDQNVIENYLRAMTEKDEKGFRAFFIQLFVRNDIS